MRRIDNVNEKVTFWLTIAIEVAQALD